ncbi:hypothetical protein FOL47_003091 [Perkinsus chesapeaki]|uniref:Uncharacterized protein n=1 Tax=Perkinsus chesapeaki TaxID=330153 RepID=A0A7J6MAC1_PERCH|nr:hypothetical protein FOL47_003091 [Perkinsus chesapeaki]
MTSRNSLSDSLIIADAVGLWPRVSDRLELGHDISDVEYLNNTVAVACGEDRLIEYENGREIKMPVKVEKMAFLSEGSLAVSTPDNNLYLLSLDNDGVWHRQAKIGNYNHEPNKITGIANSDKYGLLVLTNNGDIHIWDMSTGIRRITHSSVPDVERYTALTTSGGDDGILISAIKSNHQAVQENFSSLHSANVSLLSNRSVSLGLPGACLPRSTSDASFYHAGPEAAFIELWTDLERVVVTSPDVCSRAIDRAKLASLPGLSPVFEKLTPRSADPH